MPIDSLFDFRIFVFKPYVGNFKKVSQKSNVSLDLNSSWAWIKVFTLAVKCVTKKNILQTFFTNFSIYKLVIFIQASLDKLPITNVLSLIPQKNQIFWEFVFFRPKKRKLIFWKNWKFSVIFWRYHYFEVPILSYFPLYIYEKLHENTSEWWKNVISRKSRW